MKLQGYVNLERGTGQVFEDGDSMDHTCPISEWGFSEFHITTPIGRKVDLKPTFYDWFGAGVHCVWGKWAPFIFDNLGVWASLSAP